MAKRVYRKTYRAHGDLQAFLDKACAYEGDECLLWPYGKTATGYARIGAKNFGTVWVSRIVCERVHGKPPTPKHQSAHSCGNGNLGCVTPGHLRWATRGENYEDSVERGTASRGERNGGAKLTRELVEEIWKHKGKLSQRATAAKFNVDQRTVGRVFRRETWRHLWQTRPLPPSIRRCNRCRATRTLCGLLLPTIRTSHRCVRRRRGSGCRSRPRA